MQNINSGELNAFQAFLPKQKNSKKKTGAVCAVSYTRVSSREQFKTNGSLESQEKVVNRLAEQMSVPVLARFGGTYESAKSEERKEFQRMLEFISRSKENIRYIFVSDTDRFSRTGPNAIYLAEKLREKGIQVVSASSPLDTSTSIGAFQQNIQLLFSHFDNQLRREKTIRGMKQKFEKGYYIGALPTGYERQLVGGVQQIVINREGAAIKKAFAWKANQGLRTSEIALRLKKLGYKIPEKQLSAIFRNVFYCGLLSNKMLEGRIVEGKNWEPLVSRETFLKANSVLKQYHIPHDHHKEDAHVPLRRFVACEKCGTMWTGYIVKKKGLYYYKCNKKGCKCNLSASKMHEQFKQLLQRFEISPEIIAPLKDQLLLTFEQMNQDLFARKVETENQRKELSDKLMKAEERFIEGDIDRESFLRYKEKIQQQLAGITADLEQPDFPLSNQKKFVDFALKLCQDLSQIWVSGDLAQKQKFQKMIFPDGLTYDRQNSTYRTGRVNTLIAQIASLARVSAENKTENSHHFVENSPRVAPSKLSICLVVLRSTRGSHRAIAWLPSLPKIQLNPTSQTA